MANDNEQNDKRGLASADQETRERVAREGGKASHGGGRPSDESEDSSDIESDSSDEEM